MLRNYFRIFINEVVENFCWNWFLSFVTVHGLWIESTLYIFFFRFYLKFDLLEQCVDRKSFKLIFQLAYNISWKMFLCLKFIQFGFQKYLFNVYPKRILQFHTYMGLV